jgi:hypothetical protein
MLTTGDLVRRTKVSIRIGRPEDPTVVVMFARLAGQIKVGEVELRIRAFQHYDTQARAGVCDASSHITWRGAGPKR